jgi:hypothetical protein
MRIPVTAAILVFLAAPNAMAQNGAANPPATPDAVAASPVTPSASPTSPVAPGSVERKEVTGAAPDPLMVVSCIQSDPPTGSRLGAHKTCHTQQQWNTIRANSAQVLMDMQNRFDNAQEGALLAQGR